MKLTKLKYDFFADAIYIGVVDTIFLMKHIQYIIILTLRIKVKKLEFVRMIKKINIIKTR